MLRMQIMDLIVAQETAIPEHEQLECRGLLTDILGGNLVCLEPF